MSPQNYNCRLRRGDSFTIFESVVHTVRRDREIARTHQETSSSRTKPLVRTRKKGKEPYINLYFDQSRSPMKGTVVVCIEH